MLFEDGGQTVVVDTGPDFRQQMLRAQVKRLDAVVFTHPHKDHLAGMDDIRSFNFRQRQPMAVYANELTIAALKREFYYVFEAEKYPGVPSVDLHEIDEDRAFEAGGMQFQPLPVMHYKMPVLGFRVGDVAYVTDANYIPPKTMGRLRGLKVLVLNALRKTKHLSHFNLEEALALVAELQPERAYFTHISHLMGTHAETEALLPANIEIATDGLVVEV